MLSLARPSAQDRRAVISFLESLSADPYQLGDYEEADEAGRSVQIKIVGKYVLTFWADHAVREAKLVRIEKADRE